MDGVYITLPEQDKVLTKPLIRPHTHTHTFTLMAAGPPCLAKNYIQMKKKLEKAGYDSQNRLCKHKLSSIRLLWSPHWNVVKV